MDTDTDDSVVKEIPVYLCKGLSKNLYLFQFPCKTSDSTSCSRNITSTRVKPESGIIELNYGLNTDSEFYDKYMGEEFAIAESKPNTKDKNENHKSMDKIAYQSQRSILKKDINCYSVASIYDGKFCITPLQDSVSFLPTYDHIEKSKKSKPNGKVTADDSASSTDDETDDSSSAVQVTVKFSQKREKSKISQEMNHQQHLNKVAEEPWCDSTYLNNSSSTAVRLLEGLTSTVSRNRSAMLSLTQKQYLDVLVPSDTTDIMEINPN